METQVDEIAAGVYRLSTFTDAVDDDEGDSSADVASLKASLAALQAKVDELSALQAKSSKS